MSGKWQLARAIALSVLFLLVLQETALRLAFPLPELVGFERLRYAEDLTDFLDTAPPSLAHLELWWWSEPDGASFQRKMNAYGFSDGEWSLAKPPGRRRVAFVGDSFVEGLGAPDGQTMSAFFGRVAKAEGLAVETLNWGAAGFGLINYAALMADAVPQFAPDDLILVLYANDFYHVPGSVENLMRPSGTLGAPPWWKPRIAYVFNPAWLAPRVMLRLGAALHDGPMPIEVEPRFAAQPQLVRDIESYVEPEIAASMRAGRLNPAMTNLLKRSVRVLPNRTDLEPYLRVVRDYLTEHGTRIWVVYLPSLNQVSDAYLVVQQKMSAPIDEPSLMHERFQQHARDTVRACQVLGLRCLDLSPALRRAEAAGERLYWPYDAHMNATGYQTVAEEVFAWWTQQAPP